MNLAPLSNEATSTTPGAADIFLAEFAEQLPEVAGKAVAQEPPDAEAEQSDESMFVKAAQCWDSSRLGTLQDWAAKIGASNRWVKVRLTVDVLLSIYVVPCSLPQK